MPLPANNISKINTVCADSGCEQVNYCVPPTLGKVWEIPGLVKGCGGCECATLFVARTNAGPGLISNDVLHFLYLK